LFSLHTLILIDVGLGSTSLRLLRARYLLEADVKLRNVIILALRGNSSSSISSGWGIGPLIDSIDLLDELEELAFRLASG
jgi:hypothetical protein